MCLLSRILSAVSYRSYSGCGGMIDLQKVDLGYAEAQGFTVCKRCH